jgi:hypothetical protein
MNNIYIPVEEALPDNDAAVEFKVRIVEEYLDEPLTLHTFGIFKDDKFYAYCGPDFSSGLESSIFKEVQNVIAWKVIPSTNQDM